MAKHEGNRGGRGRGRFGDRKRTYPDGGLGVVPQEESQKTGANAEGPRAKKQKIASQSKCQEQAQCC
uniref:4F5 domain-containing protein n=1 Tax=Rhabditophanes sp. KR3021 TaxID=114890 RepID=A0AC35TQW2_9BILA